MAAWSDDRAVVAFIALIAGVGAALSESAPTGNPVLDAVYRIGWAVLLTVAASSSRRWSWVIAGGASLAMSDGAIVPIVCGALALLLAVVAVAADERTAGLGAAIGATSAIALLHLPALGPQGLQSLVLAVVTACVLGSAYAQLRRRRHRRLARRVAIGVAAVVAVGAIGAGVAALLGAAAGDRALDASRAWLAAAQRGASDEDVTAQLDLATDEFASASAAFSGWYTLPARLVPGLNQQLDLATTVADEGHAVARSATDAFKRGGNYRTMAMRDGRVDLERLATFDEPLTDARASLEHAGDAAADLDLEWALPPLRNQVERFEREVGDALDTTETAIEAVRVAPTLFGATEEQRYFVAFLQPSEIRGLGGFMGSWAVLTARDGAVELTETGRAEDLFPALGTGFDLDAPEDYVAAYGQFEPQNDPRDISLSPDFPSAAQVYASVYEQSTGLPVDGVIALDPYSLAALIEITGPIEVDELAEPLTEENAARFLLHDQYLGEQRRADRVDLLDEVAREVFDRLTGRVNVRPTALARLLGPLVAQHRVLVHATDPEVQAFLERIGVAGAFGAAEDEDFLAVTNQNGSNNKIDYFLHREVAYAAQVDPTTGEGEATVTVTLRNDAPATGLPGYIIGDNNPETDHPDGTNLTTVTVYTPHGALDAELDGSPVGVSSRLERGLHAYGTRIPIPPGGTATLTIRLRVEGDGAPLTFRYRAQPTVWADALTVDITAPDGRERLATTVDPVSEDVVLREDPVQ